MRAATFFLALSAVVASVSAANINIFRRQYPDCANPCIQNAQTGNCFSDDLNCLCQSSAFINSTTSCIIASCNAADTKTAEAVAQGFCETVGVTLTSTPASQPTGSTPAPSSASSTGSSASSAASSPTSATSPSPAAPSPSPSGTASDASAHGANALLALGALGLGALML